MMKKKIALLGRDVSKSLSPVMQNAAFEFLKLPFVYAAVSVPEENFEKEFLKFKREGYAGFNITMPYKERALPLVQKQSDCAKKLGAANTIIFNGMETRGENTDVDGFLSSIKETGCSFQSNETAFIFGAGGAARATVEALSLLGIKNFAIAGRSPDKLERFSIWLKNHYPFAQSKFFSLEESSRDYFFDMIDSSGIFVNAAPPEACKEIPFFSEIQFRKEMIVADWVYYDASESNRRLRAETSDAPRSLLETSREPICCEQRRGGESNIGPKGLYFPQKTPWLEKGKGIVIPGQKMLLYQGAKSFELWTGVKAPVQIMEKALSGDQT